MTLLPDADFPVVSVIASFSEYFSMLYKSV